MPDIQVYIRFAFIKKWVGELAIKALITAC